MPNWCSNELNISGPKEDMFNLFRKIGYKGKTIKSLDTFCKKASITLSSWYPIPKTFKNWDTTNKPDTYERFKNNNPSSTEKDYNKYLFRYQKAKNYQQKHYGCIGWYEYNMKTFGVKWDCPLYGFYITEDKNCIYCDVVIDSPWSPPETWLQSMIKDFPTLNWIMKFDEPGQGLYGRYYSDGEGNMYY